jgi:hypothetical protein
MLGIFRKNVTRFNTQTQKEVKWWAYAAWTSPFAALSGLFLAYVFEWDGTFNKILIVTGTVFFSAAVIWWWWAIFKVSRMAHMLVNTAEELKEISTEMHKINREMHQNDK